MHLVRDPRATVFSLVNRPKKRIDDPEGSTMLSFDPERAIGLWLRSNRQAACLAPAPGCRYLFVRYEDFVGSPRAAAARIVEFARESPERVGDHDMLEVPVNHTISGNPDRLLQHARIRQDGGVYEVDRRLRTLVEGPSSLAFD